MNAIKIFEKSFAVNSLTFVRHGGPKYNMRKIQSSNARSGVHMRDTTYEVYNFNKELNPPQDIWAAVKDPKYTDVEEVTGRWHYVERLFPKLCIPVPPGHASPVGWKPPAAEVPDLPYFVARTNAHMLPVYLGRITIDFVVVTKIRKIQGDIWQFEADLKKYLKKIDKGHLKTQVNEICCTVNVSGDHVQDIKQWLYDTGF